jgi:hypothetical protein
MLRCALHDGLKKSRDELKRYSFITRWVFWKLVPLIFST